MFIAHALTGGLLWPLRPASPLLERPPTRRFGHAFEALRGPVADTAALTADLLHHGGRVVVFGQGGSQQAAVLLAGEINRRAERWAPRRRAFALHVNADDTQRGIVTAARARPGDIAWWLVAHGQGAALVPALLDAHGRSMANVAIVGDGAGAIRQHFDICLALPPGDPMQLQEAQLYVGHALVRQIDAALRAPPR